MTDEHHEFPFRGEPGHYALLPDVTKDIKYASDDSDSGTAIPSTRNEHTGRPTISKLSHRLLALMPRSQVGNFSSISHIIGDGVNGAVPADSPADSAYDEGEDVEEDSKTWEPFGTARGFGPPPHPYSEWAYIGPYAYQYPTLLGGQAPQLQEADKQPHDEDSVDSDADVKSHANEDNAGSDVETGVNETSEVPDGPAPSPQLGTALERYEAHLQATVSAQVEATPLGSITFSMWQLKCVDEASYVSQKHMMLIQRSFAIPGFRFEGVWTRHYVDGKGERHPFDMVIPYHRRRLWVSLLATGPGHANTEPHPQELVMNQLSRIFKAAIRAYEPGKCIAHSPEFARLVSHHLKAMDPVYRDFNITSDIQYVLKEFPQARRMYKLKGPLYPQYIRPHPETLKFVAKHLQGLVEFFIWVMQREEAKFLEGNLVEAQVKKEQEEYCPETDTEEGAATLQARSNRPDVSPQVRQGKIPWLGYGPDPHDDSDSDF